jgi:hypothetical protein
MKLHHSLALVLATLAVAACDQGREAPLRTAVTVTNAAPEFGRLEFLRGAQPTGSNSWVALGFKDSSATQYDEDTYNFQVAAPITNADPDIWRFTKSVRSDTNYVFVLTGDAGAVEPVFVEFPAPAANATAVQITGTNASTLLPAIDLYLQPAGAGIVGAAPRGTLAFQQLLTPLTVPPGDYEITLTEGGNPANVLFTSNTITLAATSPTTIVITPEGGLGTADLSVMLVGSTRAILYDRNATAEMRVINGATDRQPRDVALGGQFTPPLFSAATFAVPSAYTTIPVAETQDINVTPPGNPGVLELDSDLLNIAAGRRYTMIFTGPAGTLSHFVTDDDGRALPNEAKVRFFDAAPQFPVADLLIMAPDADPLTTAAVAQIQLTAPGAASYVSVPAGEYDLRVFQSASATPSTLAGPVRVTLAGGGIYGVIATDGATTTTADLFLIDDFP